LFCAAGSSGGITTSPDGITWTNRSPGRTTFNINSVMWTGTRFIALLQTSGAYVAISEDGVSWRTSAMAGSISASVPLFGFYAGGKAVVSMASIYGGIQSSTDGLTWQACDQISRAAGFQESLWSRVYKFGSIYFACGTKGLFRSTDGVTFLPVASSPVCYIVGMAFDGAKYLAACNIASANVPFVIQSTDGVVWTKAADFGTSLSAVATTPGPAKDLVYASGNFVLLIAKTASQNLSCPIYISANGTTWTGSQLPYNQTGGDALASDGSTIVSALGANYGYAKSVNGGATWSLISAAAVGGTTSPVYNNGVWNLGGSISTDLSTFTLGANANVGMYCNNNFCVSMANSPSNSRNFFNAKANGFVGAFAVTGYPTNTFAAAKEFVVRGNVALIPTRITSSTSPNLILEYPLYSYDTATTFWVPPSTAGVGQVPYIYAGA